MNRLAEKTRISLYPERELRHVPIATAAYILSFELDKVRTRENYSFIQAVETFVTEHGVSIPHHETSEIWADEIWTAIRSDKVRDSERQMAQRAARKMLAWRFPFGRVTMRGWFQGTSVVLPTGRFELTGRACERCGVNPEAYGIGGGIRCVDTRDCGWWFCH